MRTPLSSTGLNKEKSIIEESFEDQYEVSETILGEVYIYLNSKFGLGMFFSCQSVPEKT